MSLAARGVERQSHRTVSQCKRAAVAAHVSRGRGERLHSSLLVAGLDALAGRLLGTQHEAGVLLTLAWRHEGRAGKAEMSKENLWWWKAACVCVCV